MCTVHINKFPNGQTDFTTHRGHRSSCPGDHHLSPPNTGKQAGAQPTDQL